MMTTATDRRSLVTCEAAGELFALDVTHVERVLRFAAPRRLPNSASWLLGVIAVGDRLVPVLDLRERMGLAAMTARDVARARVVVVRLGDGPVGFIVDAVHEVVAVEGAAVEPAPSIYRGLAKEFVQGIVRRDEGLFILLDADRLVTSTERIAMRDAVAQEGRDGR